MTSNSTLSDADIKVCGPMRATHALFEGIVHDKVAQIERVSVPARQRSRGMKLLAAVMAGSMLATGCVTDGNTYSRAAVGVPYEVYEARLVGVEPVRIDGRQTGLGAASGAALGGALGSRVGRNRGYYGRRTNVAGAIGFAILGGLVGAAIEEGASGGNGFRYTLELEDGRTITVVQGDREPSGACRR